MSLSLALADYNADVLRLVTVPNLLLVWALSREIGPKSTYAASDEAPESDGDLEITTELIQAFKEDLVACGISLTLISGPWGSPDFHRGLSNSLTSTEPLLALAAETIYSPASLSGFCEVLQALLKHVPSSRAYVAAKRIYFGVGGGVHAFLETMASHGGHVSELADTGIRACDGGGGGVGRCLMEVRAA